MCTQPPPLSRNMFKVAIKFQSNLISHTFFELYFKQRGKKERCWVVEKTNEKISLQHLSYLFPLNLSLSTECTHMLMCYFMLPAQWCTYRNRFRYVGAFFTMWEREGIRRFFRSQEVIKWRIFIKNYNYFCNLKVRWSPFEVHLDLKYFSSLKFRILCECY